MAAPSPTAPGRRSGGAGLFSTAEDVAKFYQMMLTAARCRKTASSSPPPSRRLTRKQTGDLKARPACPGASASASSRIRRRWQANRHLLPRHLRPRRRVRHQSWADPLRGLVYVFMIERDKIPPNPDNSAMRRAYHAAVEAALTP
jgi:CubicO group peptidase (beta-lactamase class C family)